MTNQDGRPHREMPQALGLLVETESYLRLFLVTPNGPRELPMLRCRPGTLGYASTQHAIDEALGDVGYLIEPGAPFLQAGSTEVWCIRLAKVSYD